MGICTKTTTRCTNFTHKKVSNVYPSISYCDFYLTGWISVNSKVAAVVATHGRHEHKETLSIT